MFVNRAIEAANVKPERKETMVTLTEEQAHSIFKALDAARDAIQPVTMTQIALFDINPKTDVLLDEAMETLAPLLGLKKSSV